MAGGTPTLERNHGDQLMHALTSHMWCHAGVFVRFVDAAIESADLDRELGIRCFRQV